jgi:hypothetical protein
MTITAMQTSFVGGEVSPQLYGRVDLAKYKNGASTMRNMFVNYRGGASSRAGTAYVGMCKQGAPNLGGTATSNPPRDIPFQFSLTQGYALEFGDQYMRIKSNGAYVIENTKTITGITRANPAVLTVTSHGYSVGDWIFIKSVQGMTNFNGLIWIVGTAPDANHITLTDLFGTTIDSTNYSAYTSGGTTARVYTVTAPYAAIDLPYLKYTQSANTMTLCCVNQQTNTEYPSYELVRNGATSWTFTADSFTSSISAPTGVTSVAQSSTTKTTFYAYCVTAVSEATGEESVASTVTEVENNNIAINAGSNIVSWNTVSGASSYNIYAAVPCFGAGVQIGTSFGYIGTSLGGSFIDSNIIVDYTRSPPINVNPFARGPINLVNVTAQGSGYTQGTVGYTITTSTGSGFSGTPIILNGAFIAFVVVNPGQGYAQTDTITITGGTGGTATLEVGPAIGTYPSCPAYFQQRRVYANTLNNPDTYYMSQPGAYANFDTSTPTVDSDAITGTPWAQQVNGIQFLVPMTGGLVVLTGSGAWNVSGGSSAAITPADQTAQAQAYNGCSAIVPPIVVNYDILYVQSKGSIVRDLAYNFFVNIYTGSDMTVLSNHLFLGHQIKQWAYCEEPYKLIWCVREDGILLSLTYLKEQDVYSWARHDTNGIYIGVCSVTEPPVDALYTIVQRYVRGNWVYYSERMDNRIWQNVENCFCVDAGLTYPQSYPAATLNVSGTTGSVIMTASAAIFGAGIVGSVIRVAGGKITVTGFTSSTVLQGLVTQTLTGTIPNDPNNGVIPATSGTWSYSTPTTVVSGLNHLEGLTVTGLADGGVIVPMAVVNGSITLQTAASAITVGLAYQPQLQTLYMDAPTQGGTMQGKRKDIYNIVVRTDSSRGFSVGTNQPDQATQPNNATVAWTNMKEVKERNALISAGSAIPLFTGDSYVPVPADWNTGGQAAVEQNYPLPLNVLGLVNFYEVGDSAG